MQGSQFVARRTPGGDWTSHRHLAVPHRAPAVRLSRVDDGVGVDAVVAIEVGNRAGLAEMLDAERFTR